ncbi:radical SAM protein [Geomonas anaerohicana]|uniref:Radical SAM protein n=1 Tax=Geomonas anaerohicana TaxID=2798583 RepID=A0ABS0YH10_9BACT|nr:radical SAM protein [Geomonas anaerohicana]MBJ6751548.1 radical SAM protein [Geomonas anaerohicana]
MTKVPFCFYPFYFMEFAFFGKVFSCCPAHVKKEIGNIGTQTIAEIWNGDYIRFMRSELLKGDWENTCDPSCPFVQDFIHNNKFQSLDDLVKNQRITRSIAEEITAGRTTLTSMPTVFNFCNSDICNLDCIMCCCKGMKSDTDLTKKAYDDAFKYLPTLKTLALSGSGDPFACTDTRNLLMSFEGHKYPETKIQLLTNGLLLPKFWDQVKHNNFSFIGISIDAASKETYELIRKNGRWDDLLRALDFINSIRERFSGVMINMTVMKHNYHEIEKFLELGVKYNFGVSFNEVRVEGNASQDLDIFSNVENDDFPKFVSIVKEASSKKYPVYVNWGNLSSYTKWGC